MLDVDTVVAAIEHSLDADGRPSEPVPFSRSHFDHLVRAAVGEPPGALRRRVLLERAAWRLLTGRDRVIDVAVDAGYESPDAFTRAFGRAFGASPAGFRRDARSDWSIAAPNRIHFHPPGGLRLRTTGRSTAVDVLARMTDHHVATLGAILDRMERVPERLDEPIRLSVEGIDAEPTLRGLADRMVAQLEMWVTAIEGGAELSAGSSDLPSLRRRLEAAAPRFTVLVVDAVAAGRAEEVFVDLTCLPPRSFTIGGVLAHVLTFAAVRRTMAIGALESAGIGDLGSGDPMRAVGGEGEDAARVRRNRAERR